MSCVVSGIAKRVLVMFFGFLFSVAPSFSFAQVSHSGCPREEDATAVLIAKRYAFDGRVICRFAYEAHKAGSNVPFPLKYVFSDCTAESDKIEESITYHGVVYYEYDESDSMKSSRGVCSMRFKVLY